MTDQKSDLNEPEGPNATNPYYDATVAPRHVAAAESTISPKVLAGAATGLVLAIVVAVLGAVTPDMLASLGAWAPLAFVAITTAATQLAGYLKRDPLREV